MIIDFHTHTFPDKIAKAATYKLGKENAHIYPFTDGTRDGLLSSMNTSGIDYSVTLPVLTNPGQVDKINHTLMEETEKLMSTGIIPFGGIHPDYLNIRDMMLTLKSSGIRGVKLHPAYQGCDLNDIKMKRILYHASELDMIILIHAGIDIGIYDHNYASVDHILEILKEIAPPKLVLAHMGNWGCWDQVESDLAGAPVWLDTSFCLGQITKHPESELPPTMTLDLTEEDFIRLSRKHGVDKILFATDSPWMDQSEYVNILRKMPMTEEEKNMLLSENAIQLLNLHIDS